MQKLSGVGAVLCAVFLAVAPVSAQTVGLQTVAPLPPIPEKSTQANAVRSINRADVACVIEKLGDSGRQKVENLFVSKILDKSGQPSSANQIVPVVLPPLMECEKTLKWPQDLLGAAAFHVLGKITADHFLAKAETQKFDLPAMRRWFDAQPTSLRTGWFGRGMDIGFADAELLRMLCELEASKTDTNILINDLELTKIVMKSYVISARLDAGLGSF
jgi:hypothetical protein